MTALIGALKPYIRQHHAGAQSRMMYLKAEMLDIGTASVFGLIRSAIMLALIAPGENQVAGVGADTLVAYVWVSQGIMGAISFWSPPKMSRDVKSGQVLAYFVRPLDIFFSHAANESGDNHAKIVLRALPVALAVFIVMGTSYPGSALHVLAGMASVVIAGYIYLCIRLFIATLGFWMTETQGLMATLFAVAGILGGLMVPVWMMPQWMQTIAYATPFPATMQMPSDIIVGLTPTHDIPAVLGVQILWAAGLTITTYTLATIARRHVVVNGG